MLWQGDGIQVMGGVQVNPCGRCWGMIFPVSHPWRCKCCHSPGVGECSPGWRTPGLWGA